jgi:hypothetical protein
LVQWAKDIRNRFWLPVTALLIGTDGALKKLEASMRSISVFLIT